jgi:hypothetical protein
MSVLNSSIRQTRRDFEVIVVDTRNGQDTRNGLLINPGFGYSTL